MLIPINDKKMRKNVFFFQRRIHQKKDQRDEYAKNDLIKKNIY